MTPADTPSAMPNRDGFVIDTNFRFKITRPPIHVDNPAAILSANANKIRFRSVNIVFTSKKTR